MGHQTFACVPRERSLRTPSWAPGTPAASVKTQTRPGLIEEANDTEVDRRLQPQYLAETVNLFGGLTPGDVVVPGGNYLPHRVDPVIGRDREIVQIEESLSAERPYRVLLHGVPGVGRRVWRSMWPRNWQPVMTRLSTHHVYLVRVSQKYLRSLSRSGCSFVSTRARQYTPHAVEAVQALLGSCRSLVVLTDVISQLRLTTWDCQSRLTSYSLASRATPLLATFTGSTLSPLKRGRPSGY